MEQIADRKIDVSKIRGARDATRLVQKLHTFPHDIYVGPEEKQHNGKSIMSLLLVIAGDRNMRFELIGPDPEKALDEIEKFMREWKP